jgi:hypothetical protein
LESIQNPQTDDEFIESKNDDIDDIDINSSSTQTDEVYPASINVSKDDSSIYELKRQFDNKRIELSPPYQRGKVWSQKQKSELVESILMGIPLPIMYFFQDSNGIKQVIDGKQRLSTLFDFMSDDQKVNFSLAELSILKDLKGKRFKDLDGVLQGKIEDYKMSINVIKPPTPDRIKFDIFDRVNRGGTRLNNQEMRNAIYNGYATNLLDRLKDDKNFKNATDNSVRSKVMKDRYMILRFIAFYLWRTKKLTTKDGDFIDYKSDIDDFLGKTMEYLNRTKLKEIEAIFQTTMSDAFSILGKDGFRVSNYYGDKDRKTPVNMALFECLSYAIALSHTSIYKDKIKDKIKKLFTQDKFMESITSPVDSSSKVRRRFDKVDEILLGLKND